MIKLQNVNLKYRKVIFKDMNLEEISTPGIYGIIGESGIGKSTLLNILYGLELNYEGKYFLGNNDLSNSIDVQKYYSSNITLIHQDFKLLTKYSAIDNIKMAMIDKRDVTKIYTLAEKLNITKETLHKKVKYLSGGEKQRIAILRGVINDPKVILFDEPTSGLDRVNRQNFIDLLQPLKDLGIIVIIVSHDFVLRNHLDNVYEIYDHGIYLTKGESIVSETNDIEVIKNNKLSKFVFKSIFNNKVVVSLFLLLSTVFILGAIFLISPVALLIEEYQLYTTNTFETVDIITYSEDANIEELQSIDGVEEVSGYDYYISGYSNIPENLYISTGQVIETNNVDGFYNVENPEILSKAYFQGPTTMTFTYKNVSENSSSFVYEEGKAPSNINEVAVGEKTADIIMEEKNINTVVGLELPLTCTNIITKEKTPCNKTITGVVNEYKYESPDTFINYSMENIIGGVYLYELPTSEIDPELMKVYDLVGGLNYNAINLEIDETKHDQVVTSLNNLDYQVYKDSTNYYETSTYNVELEKLFDSLKIFYVLGAIFIFVASYAYLITKKRELAIYLTQGYSKKQIFKSVTLEMFIIYVVAYTIATMTYILVPYGDKINYIWLVLSFITFISFYLLAIFYIILSLSKKNIAKQLK